MKNKLKLQYFKLFKEYKFVIISASIFILYSLDRYLPRGYKYYSDDWGVDQYFIENIARKVLQGDSLIGHLSHGIGYSLVIAPFINIAANPMNVAGFFIFTITASIIFKNIDLAIKGKKLRLILIFALIISFAFAPDMKFWVIGASNTLSAVLILLSVLWSISPIVPKSLPIILGVLSGIVFSARYLDYLLLFPLYFAAILNFSRIYKKSLINNLILSFLISLIFIVPMLFLHSSVFGDPFITPYNLKPSDVIRLTGFDLSEGKLGSRYYSWIIPNLYSTIVNYKSFASNLAAKGEPTALLIFPILFFAPYSLTNLSLALFKLPQNLFKRKLIITVVCSLASLTIWTIFYASGWAYTVHDIFFQCLRYFMGWFTIIGFLTLYGLTLKPNIKTFLISSFLYVLLFGYPSIYLKNEFKNVKTIKTIEVIKNDSEDIKKEYNLPIPFDYGKKSLLATTDNGEVISVDNFSNELLLGKCHFNNFNLDTFDRDFSSCKFYKSGEEYLSENGMNFLNLKNKKNTYEISYELLEQEIPKTQKLLINLDSYTNIESNGNYKVFRDNKDRFVIKDKKQKKFYLKRDNKNYLNNSNNIYWPNWEISAAEEIDSKNQILTNNKKSEIYCIWELDKKWNFKRDRLCSNYDNVDLRKHEEEFKVDINSDGYINRFLITANKEDKYINQNSKFLFKVNPIRFEKSKFVMHPQIDDSKDQNLELNIKLNKTGDGQFRNFPNNVSINCNDNLNSCLAYKIGRFNNLWKIWIKKINSLESLTFTTEDINKNKPSFWAIQYITLSAK